MSLINNLRTILSLKGKSSSDLPSTTSMVDWMLQLNKEIPDLDTLIRRLEMIERINSDMKELEQGIQKWSALYERICVDYASLLNPTDNHAEITKPEAVETVVEVVDALPADVAEKLRHHNTKLASSFQNGKTQVPVRGSRSNYRQSRPIRYRIRTNT